ncbi:esterase [Prolixibacter denitrificans]|uniref:Enterochelin esterase family protein n=2 Tax=Prolixibacter denitrificans TaxID=1541063 RepID=A0A2P8CE77_9BACT|nr:esterase [Prolixibacter denitrificans]PSK83270.1 enterochelin esterase family protein [Prolixibacter denitrificans]
MKQLLFTLLFAFVSCLSYGQQDLFHSNPIVSPEINADHTVTFRIMAPNAKEVSASGSLDGEHAFANITYEMQKGDSGVWTFTTPVLPSEFYRYHFTVDGVRTVDPANAHAIRDVGNISNVFLIGGGKADLYKVNDVPHGTVAYRWYNSPGNGMMRRLSVYTPPGYENSTAKFPVLYLFHGVGGDEEAWLGSGRASEIMDNLIAQGKAEPMIVVMTNGNVSQEAAPGEGIQGFVKPTFMLPHTMDGKFEETFIDVMKFIESNYRTPATKESRAIAGLSMGGFHTANISLYYPNTFDYVGLFSSALGVRPMNNNPSPVYQNQDEKLKQQMENGYKLYWMGMGVDDMPMIYNGNKNFREKMDSIGMKYEYVESKGGHTWNNWRDYLSIFAQRLFK